MGLPIAERNSRRVEESSRKAPIIWLVTIVRPVFSTPRVVIHPWLASITTPTPFGCKTVSREVAICAERRGVR